MDRPEIIQAMALISTFWPHWKLPTAREEASVMVDAWGRLLGDLEASTVTAAIEAYATTGADFAPGPGVLRKRAIELVSPPVPDGDAAWGEVVDQIARVGYIGRPTFSHPAIEAVVQSFGWVTLCQSETQMADRAHFLRVYDEVRTRTTFQVTAPPSVLALLDRVASQRPLTPGGDGGDRDAIDGVRHALDPGPGRG